MPTPSFTEDKATAYAYHGIHDFFDHYGLSGALEDMERILKLAVSHKSWKTKDPCNVLLYMEKLEELSAAAFAIMATHSTRAGTIVKAPDNGEPDMSQQQDYLGSQVLRTVWNYFPRHLTAGQYFNPYKALRRFTAYMTEAEWKNVFKEITGYALCNGSIDDEGYPYNILTLRLRLLQLIEACHLLEVRSNKTIPSQQQKRSSTKK